MTRVFVCGPYWDNNWAVRLANVFRAKTAAAELVRRGYAVYCPHLMHYMPQDGITEAMWRRQDMAWLRASDYVFRLPGASAGADEEVEFVRQLYSNGGPFIPIYHSLDDFPNLLEKIEEERC